MADHPFTGTLNVTGNVGIGTEPSLNAQLYIKSTSAASQVFLESGGGTLLKLNVDNSGATLGTENNFPLNILTNGSPRLSIDESGNVGIGISPTLTEKLSVNGSIKATSFLGNGTTLDGVVKETGDTMTGSLTVNATVQATSLLSNGLTVNGNINTTGIISGSSLPPNLIKNSYMNILDGNKPAGYNVLGKVTLDAVHPYTKGFEGPYVPQKPSNAASSADTATEANPYWFASYYKGSRASRGGLGDGWSYGTTLGGKILKITGDTSEVHTCVFFPFESNVLTNKVHFKAWLKITSGSKVGFGEDSGGGNVVRGLIITKEQTDAALDGWHQIDAVVGISGVTSLSSWSFSMGIEANGKFEIYLALPYLTNVDNGSWLPSVSDMLSRDGLTVHPSSGNVGIGTTSPRAKLEVAGGMTILEQEEWQTPQFQNGWVDYGHGYAPAGYFKDSLGIVHLRGVVSNPLLGDIDGQKPEYVIFTLPQGYRPPMWEIHPSISGSAERKYAGLARITIDPDGKVWVMFGHASWLTLDGITFRA